MSLIPTREQEEFNKLFPIPKMTTKGEWVAYTGSDDQIADLEKAKNGIIAKNTYGHIWDEIYLLWDHAPIGATHYWIIPDDPLREMKIRQARTGQPVYVKTPSKRAKGKFSYYKTTNPNWDEIGAEYSFTAFEE